jgi:hypothetical protein
MSGNPGLKMPNVFADLRARYFEIARPASDAWDLGTSAPWGAIMEVAYPAAVVTTVSLADGTVSVLRSTGGGLFGGGDEVVQRAGKGFLKRADTHQKLMRVTEEISQPPAGWVRFFLRTGNGILSTSAEEAALRKPDHPLFQLYCAGIQILHEYLALQKRTPR